MMHKKIEQTMVALQLSTRMSWHYAAAASVARALRTTGCKAILKEHSHG